jgi:hypothetical protein
MTKPASTRIPNRHVYVWTGRTFPLFARLSVESSLLAAPEADVQIWTFGPRPDGAPHFEALRALPRVSFHDADPNKIFAGLAAPVEAYTDLLAAIPAHAHSARSNLVRYGILHTYGGVYLDFDTLLLRGFDDLLHEEAFFGAEEVWRVDEHRVAGEVAPWMVAPTVTYIAAWLLRRAAATAGVLDVFPRVGERLDRSWSVTNLNNAVIGAAPRSRMLRRVLDAALQADPKVRYRLGPTLVTHVWRSHPEHVRVVPPDWFYSVPPSYSFRFFDVRPWALPPDAHLLHYVSSNHGRVLRDLDEETILARRDRAPFWQQAARVIDARGAMGR